MKTGSADNKAILIKCSIRTLRHFTIVNIRVEILREALRSRQHIGMSECFFVTLTSQLQLNDAVGLTPLCTVFQLCRSELW